MSVLPTVPAVVSPEDAHDHYRSNALVFVDARWYADGRTSHDAYVTLHIRDARFVDIDSDLSSTQNVSPSAGRHPLPDPAHFADAMSRLGISDTTWVVAYDDTGGMTASRLVVMLRMIGHRASLLDGGLGVWADLYPDLVDHGVQAPVARGDFTTRTWPDSMLVTHEEMIEIVRRGADTSGTVVLDARAPERFSGSAPSGPGTLDPRAGHIPGAVNAPWSAVISPETRRLLAPAALRSHFAGLDIDRAADVISSCGSGISACLNILAFEHAGLGTPRLFVPSWSGWSTDESRPVETGRSSFAPDRLHRSADTRQMRAVHDLRLSRRRHRLADLEWFDALYRVYLAAFVFGGGAMFIAGFVPDDEVSSRTAADIWVHGPSWLGLAAILAIGIGLRSGSRGGPLAIEEADVRHLLLAPLDRRRVLLRPALQAVRTSTFATLLAGILTGYLAARRLPGTAPHWIVWGGIWAAVAGLLYVGSALVAHGIGLPRWVATGLAVGLFSWQLLAALPDRTGLALDVPGPGDLHGELGLSFHGVTGSAFVFPAIALLLVGCGCVLVGRHSLESLVRRSSLVSQLRFAVTVQDLRTVTLLRRRLSEEKSRARPWFGQRRHRTHRDSRFGPEWSRAWRGIARFPSSRLVRIAALNVVAGLALASTYLGTTPGIVVAGGALFMVALEWLEPLAQEIDQSDRTWSYPHLRGSIHLRLLAPVLVLIPVSSVVLVVTMLVVEREMWLVSIIGALSAGAAACAGATVNIIAGSPDPTNTAIRQNTMPPEVAGTVSIIKTLWPVALAIAGCLPVAVASVAQSNGESAEAAALRAGIAVALGVGLVAAWVRKRDNIRASLDRAISESRGTLQKGQP